MTRFRSNVRQYPRTFAFLLALAALDALLDTYSVAALRADAVVAIFAGFAYVWFMSDYRRVALLTQLLDNFEGREPVAVTESETFEEPEETIEEEELQS